MTRPEPDTKEATAQELARNLRKDLMESGICSITVYSKKYPLFVELTNDFALNAITSGQILELPNKI